jgi:hypothetical protein
MNMMCVCMCGESRCIHYPQASLYLFLFLGRAAAVAGLATLFDARELRKILDNVHTARAPVPQRGAPARKSRQGVRDSRAGGAEG